jgi:hypothetical protein
MFNIRAFPNDRRSLLLNLQLISLPVAFPFLEDQFVHIPTFQESVIIGHGIVRVDHELSSHLLGMQSFHLPRRRKEKSANQRQQEQIGQFKRKESILLATQVLAVCASLSVFRASTLYNQSKGWI